MCVCYVPLSACVSGVFVCPCLVCLRVFLYDGVRVSYYVCLFVCLFVRDMFRVFVCLCVCCAV